MKALAALCLVVCFATAAQAGSSSCDIGQYWYNISGTFSWVSSGDAGVWGVNSAGSAYYRGGSYVGSSSDYKYDGRNNGFSSVNGNGWQLIPVSGSPISQLDVGKNSVWGVKSDSLVIHRRNISAAIPAGLDWIIVYGLSAIHVSVSDVDGKVWAVSTDNRVYRRVGISDENPYGSSWEHVNLNLQRVRYVDVGGAGVWATTTDGSVYYLVGSRTDCQGSGWRNVQGGLKQVVSGGDAVWGVNSAGAVYYRFNVVAANPTGTEWIQVPGTFKQLSVSTSNNALWGVTTGGSVYYRQQ